MKPYSYPLFFLCGAASLFGATASATVGQSVAFSVTASGTAPFTYVWRKGGTTIPGATANPYVIASAALADAGDYSAVVLNSAGSTTSDIATLSVTAATVPPTTAYAPDFSNSYAELSLSGVYTPSVAVFPDFVVVPVKKMSDPGSHFNDATSIYTTDSAGVYSVKITIRTQDQPPPDVSIGITSGIDNKDNSTLWVVTPSKSAGYIRFGAEHEIIRTLPSGAQIRCNVFVQSAITIQGYDVVIRRIY